MNGERLRAARLRANLTQAELGHAVGISQSMVGSLERGARAASPDTARQLAAALGVARDWLLDREGDRAATPDTLLDHPLTPQGLRDLASDRVLAASLDIQPTEWHALRSLALPGTATKDGYLALLLTIRLVCGGRGTPDGTDAA